MSRLFYIDVIRFLAIFLVTGFHVARFIQFDKLHSFGLIFKNAFINGGWLGCCLFFLISGYCLCFKYNDNVKYFDFLKNRLIKIIPTYYIAIIIWYFLVKMGIAPKPIDISAILTHIFLVHNFDNSNFYSISGVFWFLGVLFNFYLIFPFLYKLQSKTKFGLETLALILFVITVCISSFFNIKTHVLNKSILINLPCFIFGMTLYKNQTINLLKNKIFKFSLLIITIVSFLFAKSFNIAGTPINIIAILESLLLGTTCIVFKEDLEKIPVAFKNFISEIAIASYSIYLYNYIFYATKPLYRNTTVVFIYILLVFGFGFCMYKLIEKPLNDLINKLRRYS